MSMKWTARGMTATLTVVFMTQPGFAAAHARHPRAAKPVATARAAADAGAAVRLKFERIEKRGEEVSAAVRLKFEPRVAALAEQVDLEGDANAAGVAERLANEFGMRQAALASEREAWAGSWGDVMIAHMLRANVRFAITPAQVFGLHKGGMGWTMVAGGLGLAVGPFVRAVESESRVAIGEVQPDGKLPAIGPAVPGNTSINAD